MEKLVPIAVVAVTTLISTIGDIFLKSAADKGWRTNGLGSLIIGVGFYVLTAFFWVWSSKLLKLSSLGVIYSLFAVLFLVVSGIVVFHERLTSVEILGMAMAITSIIILARFS